MAPTTDQLLYQRIQQLPIPEREGKDAIFNARYLEDIPNAVKEWGSERIILVVSKKLDEGTNRVEKLEDVLGKKLVGKKVGVGSHSPYSGKWAFAASLNGMRVDKTEPEWEI